MNRTERIKELREQLALEEQTQATYEAWQRDKSTKLQYQTPLQPGEWFPDSGTPVWHPSYQFRIAPAPKYVPWTAEEAIGKVVKSPDAYHIIVKANSNWCYLGEAGGQFGYDFILRQYTQPDGTPCGRLEP